MPLIPDKKETLNGLTIFDYNLIKHNPNNISMPGRARKKTVAVTIHNTEWINVSSNTTPAEQYVRATQNNAMKNCRVNYYVDDKCAWRCMPDDWVNWSCADGTSNPNSGNNTSVAIEVIGNSQAAEDNAVKLAAFLLNKYNLNVNFGLRTHTYWLNVKDGKKGTIDELNTMFNSYKYCPCYILPHWKTFKANVSTALDKLKNPTPTPQPSQPVEEKKYYRIRKSWDDANSQIGAYLVLDTAISACREGYSVFDWEGKKVYPIKSKKPDITYCSFVHNKWLNDITNYNEKDGSGYSGIENKRISGFCAKVSEGTIAYRVHIKNGGWLNWITKFDKTNWINGCAGLKTQYIDAIQMELTGVEGYQVRYRVSVLNNKNFYPWIIGTSDYAGKIGKEIDKIQVDIIKVD